MPAVSVVIPNYNHAKHLRQCINSVLGQSYADFELIIVDGDATGNSRAVIDDYSKAHIPIIYSNNFSENPYSLWQTGINLATGKWLWIVEPDDYAEPGFLTVLTKLAEEHENTGIAFCSSYWVNDGAETNAGQSVYKHTFYRNGAIEIRKHLSWQCSIQSIGSTVVRCGLARSAVKHLDLYHNCGDWIFYIHILHQANLVYTDQQLNYRRGYKHTITPGTQQWLKNGIQVLNIVDLNKIKFNFIEFVKVVKFWSAAIYRSKNNTDGEKEVLSNFVKRFFKQIKKV